METNKSSRGLVETVFKAVAVGTGVAVIVLNILKSASPDTQLMLLGIGLAALAISSLDKQ